VDGRDVGVIQGREKPCLLPEAHQPLRIVGEIIRQDLDGDLAPQDGVVGLPDDTPMPPSPIFSTRR
jgi:hypothetical protein